LLTKKQHTTPDLTESSCKVEIDSRSGFCFGVVNAIEKAEQVLASGKELYCLGDIVHNNQEIERLKKAGLNVLDNAEFSNLKNANVLFRAHGEPPVSYQTVEKNKLELVDATCPVVLKLQNRIKQAFGKMEPIGGQIVIFGKKGHAEVNGLIGQTHGKAIIVESETDLDSIDFTKPIELFSQTTRLLEDFQHLAPIIQAQAKNTVKINDTVCRQVSNRGPHLKIFAENHDLILFVGGEKSSNAQLLYGICKQANQDSHFITSELEMNEQWLHGKKNIGICGATSTPLWLMEQVAGKVTEALKNRKD